MITKKQYSKCEPKTCGWYTRLLYIYCPIIICDKIVCVLFYNKMQKKIYIIFMNNRIKQRYSRFSKKGIYLFIIHLFHKETILFIPVLITIIYFLITCFFSNTFFESRIQMYMLLLLCWDSLGSSLFWKLVTLVETEISSTKPKNLPIKSVVFNTAALLTSTSMDFNLSFTHANTSTIFRSDCKSTT